MKLNYFPINISFERFQIYTEMYSKHRLAELRNLYNETHSFFKNGNEIYISNKSADEDFVIGEIVERSTYGDSSVTSSLIKHLFFRTLDRKSTRLNSSHVASS